MKFTRPLEQTRHTHTRAGASDTRKPQAWARCQASTPPCGAERRCGTGCASFPRAASESGMESDGVQESGCGTANGAFRGHGCGHGHCRRRHRCCCRHGPPSRGCSHARACMHSQTRCRQACAGRTSCRPRSCTQRCPCLSNARAIVPEQVHNKRSADDPRHFTQENPNPGVGNPPLEGDAPSRVTSAKPTSPAVRMWSFRSCQDVPDGRPVTSTR